MFLIVLIHFAFTPKFEPIMSPQKNLARACPIIDFLLMCKVQLRALVLSVTHRMTGCGSSLTFQDANKTRDAQLFMMMVTYSRQLIKTSNLSKLSLRCRC